MAALHDYLGDTVAQQQFSLPLPAPRRARWLHVLTVSLLGEQQQGTFQPQMAASPQTEFPAQKELAGESRAGRARGRREATFKHKRGVHEKHKCGVH